MFFALLCARAVFLTLLFTVFSGQSGAEPFEKWFESPEDVVVKAIFLHERCTETFPSLRSDMDKAFGIFERANKPYFDATRGLPHFSEGYEAFRKHFAELEFTEIGCRWVIDVLSSPESSIDRGHPLAVPSQGYESISSGSPLHLTFPSWNAINSAINRVRLTAVR